MAKMRPKSQVKTVKATEFWFRLPFVKIDQRQHVLEVLEEEFPGITTELNEVKVVETTDGRAAEEASQQETMQELHHVMDAKALRESLDKEAEVSDWEDLLEDGDDQDE